MNHSIEKWIKHFEYSNEYDRSSKILFSMFPNVFPNVHYVTSDGMKFSQSAFGIRCCNILLCITLGINNQVMECLHFVIKQFETRRALLYISLGENSFKRFFLIWEKKSCSTLLYSMSWAENLKPILREFYKIFHLPIFGGGHLEFETFLVVYCIQLV